MKPLYFPGYI
jgi:hypothetical protein